MTDKLRDAAEKYGNDHCNDDLTGDGIPHCHPVMEDAFIAGYRQAIEDAAKAMEQYTNKYLWCSSSCKAKDAIRALAEK